METEYIPYATREQIKDESLHPILNYIERVLAWDIKFQYTDSETWIIWSKDYEHIIVCERGIVNISMCNRWKKRFHTSTHKDVLLELYSSLLPVIRNKSK